MASTLQRVIATSISSVLAAGLLVAGGLGGVSRPAAAVEGSDYVSRVNPWVESDRSRFFFFQSASNPFGFVKLRPDSKTDTLWESGYRPKDQKVKGFSHVHEWQLSGIQVMPTTGSGVSKLEGDSGWESPVQQATEIAEPGYHKVHLDRYGVTAELTTTDRVGMHRYTFDNAGASEILINLGGPLGEAEMKGAEVTKVGDAELSGYVDQRGTLTDSQYYGPSHGQNNRLFFHIAFDKPFDSLHGWSDGSLVDGGAALDKVSGANAGAYARYENLQAGESVQMKVGLSLTSVEGAQKNLQAELPGWDFRAVKQASQNLWNEMLGRIDVAGGTDQQQEKFYTDLFHVLSGRSTISDVDGKYLDNTWGANKVKQIPLDDAGKPEFSMYNYDALWLTQWNVNSVLGMAYPEVYSSFVKSQLQMYKDGGLLPRGPVAGDYSFVMTGSPATPFITGAYNKGIRDFDADLAFEAMLDSHSMGGMFDKAPYEYATWGENKGGGREYLESGYVPYDLHPEWRSRGAGETVEYASQDWFLAQMAEERDEKGLNIAQFGKVEVSSQLDDSANAGERAVDGRPIRSGIGAGGVEWLSTEQNPWIKLSWDEPKLIRKIVISDRADNAANLNSGMLTFSDGSQVKVKNIKDDGRSKVVGFSPRKASWVKFQATDGEGSNVGLNEIEVWDNTDLGLFLQERSSNWRNLFDEETGFIRPKAKDGTWLQDFDPLAETDFVEANAWQATWFNSYDAMGLANLLGGRNAYADKLNYAFEKSADSNFIGEGQNGLEGAYISYGNQPDLHAAHLFNYVGHPWLSQYWARQVKEKTYGSTATTDGYGHHDEDQGQMGAVSALMAMGLFEATGGGFSDPVYDITSPVFDEITIKLNPDYYSGGEFRIVTHNNSAENLYIQNAKLDGAPLDNAWFRHSQFVDGGTLELWMDDQPNKEWGVAQLPPSESEDQETVTAEDLTITGPEVVEEPYGTVQYGAEFVPENTSYKRAEWSVTEPDGSPTNKATIDYFGALTVNDQDGDVLITARAADDGGATTSRVVSIDLDPQLLRGNAAAWPTASVTASSQFNSDYAADNVRDGVIAQWSVGEWASAGEQNPWVQLDWSRSIETDSITLYDRSIPEDANAGTLTFSDGSTIDVEGIPAGGGAKTVNFPMKSIDWVRFQVTAGTGPNVGLSEFEVQAVPSVPGAPVNVASATGDSPTERLISWQPPKFDGGAPLTGYTITTYRDGAKLSEKTVNEGAESLLVGGVDGEGDYEFTVAARNLLGQGPESAPAVDRSLLRENAARWSGVTATASSEYSADYSARKVYDGITRVVTGDWASKGELNPWVQLSWDEPVTADEITVFDRANLVDNANAGTLTFSDGTTVDVSGLPQDGTGKNVTFDLKTFEWVRFQVDGGIGSNVGLSEIQVQAIPKGT